MTPSARPRSAPRTALRSGQKRANGRAPPRGPPRLSPAPLRLAGHRAPSEKSLRGAKQHLANFRRAPKLSQSQEGRRAGSARVGSCRGGGAGRGLGEGAGSAAGGGGPPPRRRWAAATRTSHVGKKLAVSEGSCACARHKWAAAEVTEKMRWMMKKQKEKSDSRGLLVHPLLFSWTTCVKSLVAMERRSVLCIRKD